MIAKGRENRSACREPFTRGAGRGSPWVLSPVFYLATRTAHPVESFELGEIIAEWPRLRCAAEQEEGGPRCMAKHQN